MRLAGRRVTIAPDGAFSPRTAGREARVAQTLGIQSNNPGSIRGRLDDDRVAAGEGGRQGDSFVIRGFSAQSDTFRDGVRDLGWFSRDTANLGGVETYFGPSAVLFGRGSTGVVDGRCCASSNPHELD